MEHFGHFTQRPSGISFFFCLAEESFGFLRKLVLLGGDGSVVPKRYARSTFFGVNDILTDLYFQ